MPRPFRLAGSSFLLLVLATEQPAAQSPTSARVVELPLDPSAWTATDSLRADTFLGRRALYIDRGAAIAPGSDLRGGTLSFDMAATGQSTFLGVLFHARSPKDAEVVFFRVGESGTEDAVQYAPALNSITSAWQVYHGPGANAAAELPRERWIPVRIELAGDSATIFVGDSSAPTLVVPRLAGTGGRRVGVWAGGFGRGAWFSNLRYARASEPAATPARAAPAGTIVEWELSQAFDASELTPGTLPDLSRATWERVRAEPQGHVLVNRYREAPIARLPVDPATRRVLRDSVMTGRVPGSKVVLARAVIEAERDEVRRMRFGFSDGVVVYANGQPLFFGMNPQFFLGQGIMQWEGQAVYLPLRRGRNEIVLAVTEFTGGWAFFGRIE